MSQNTRLINTRNKENLEYLISRKRSFLPYIADTSTASAVLTDFDSFPYKRWWRGDYESPYPVVIDREPGWRPREDQCYKRKCSAHVKPSTPTDLCFETPCSTVFPCYPGLKLPTIGKEATNIASNSARVIEYR